MTDRARLVDQPSPAPTRKVTAAALGAALATIAVWAAHAFAGVDVPPGVEGALAVVLGFVCGYLVRERDAPFAPGT